MKTTDIEFRFVIPQDVLEEILNEDGDSLEKLIADMHAYLQEVVAAGITVHFVKAIEGKLI